MNIYLETDSAGNDVRVGTSPPSGFTISSNATIDFNTYARLLVLRGDTTVTAIQAEIQAHHDSVTWASGTTAQKKVWAKWGVDTAANRAITYPVQADRETQLKEVNLISLDAKMKAEAQAKAEEQQDKEPASIMLSAVDLNYLDFSLDAEYSTNSSSFQYVPLTVIVPKSADTYPGKTIKGKFAVIYYVDTGATGELELENYTDLAAISGSKFTVSVTGAYTYAISPIFTLTEGKSYRITIRRASGAGSKSIYIESGQLILMHE